MDQDDSQQQDTSRHTPAPQGQDPDATQYQHENGRPPIDDDFFVKYINCKEEIYYEQSPLDYRLKFNKRIEKRNLEQGAKSEAYSHDPDNPELLPGDPIEPLYAFSPHEIHLLATDVAFRRESEEMLVAAGLDAGLPVNLRLAISEFTERSLGSGSRLSSHDGITPTGRHIR
ncbi:hypothetical protein FISHEDRAFT_73811 [Fistulina hepatica ATCC 64428]|uniref:Uncharacterized protein n=1 Tax=Fistulina hepatica ATCC 64428 TaxID=1128425 RepID=A0A0D7ABM3_9AGAR|nr:hypothetical protein FISHEDRAFT_73811 [Fistulina hepatica ATCC 64428]